MTLNMRQARAAWLLFLGALIALGASIFDFFWPGNGIHGTGGVLLIIASSGLVLVLALALQRLRPSSKAAYGVLLAVLLIDIVGTGFAAYMLEAWWVLGGSALALLGWLIEIIAGIAPTAVPAPATTIAALAVVGTLASLSSGLMPNARGQDDHGAAAASKASPPQSGTSNVMPEEASVRYRGWYTFNGDLMDQKFARLAQITPQNVDELQKAWEVHTGDVSDGHAGTPETNFEATPLFVDDTVYVATPFYRIFALAPDTGKVKWTFDPHTVLKGLTQWHLKSRGVAYWQAESPQPGKPCQKIVYIGTMAGKLYAVDADTGKACDGFGDHGVLDINQWNTVNNKWPLSILQPPTVYKDKLYIGWAGKDWFYAEAPPGSVLAVDAQTGKLDWTFKPIPDQDAKTTGTANIWASMSIDPQHNIVYVPVSSPSPNYYGGMREEKLPLVTSVTALDADSGKVLWSRQLVHHDIWDYDTNSAPTLVDLHKDGKTIPALVQTTKMGFLYVLNRLTGEPIFPVTEKPVPPTDVAGETISPTQPYPTKPQPTVPNQLPGISSLADWTSFGECSSEFNKLRHGPRFTPPSLKGTIEYPSTAAGVEWGGGAVDPRTNTYVVNSSNVAQILELVPRAKYNEITKKGDPSTNLANGYFPQSGAPYGFHLRYFFNRWGMPCWNPPYGTLSAYDLNTGDLLWRKPFGEVQKWGFYMPKSWGSPSIGGPVITQTGLIFIGGSMDARVRAIDLKTGKMLWRAQVDAPAVATPATYMYKGRQYVVFDVGGNTNMKDQVSDQIVAYALPKSSASG
ncbi:MAG TPA: pyrroloquinoline quinone-dependent dehydrogenase [Casimicrobiaceae bacterium]|nr:pyrroloquinoline quinone-dependent dehydrogenase [Casimicrobiaceae bacterium]